ncbi:MAG: DUF3800 domain-containing protein [Ignavibacteriaceae bacterium]
MKLDVYCDESCSEVLFDRTAHRYFALGSLWMSEKYREQFKDEIKKIKSDHNYKLEIKWNKVSPKFIDLYKALLEYFFENENLRFRALIVESEKIDLVKFHQGDAELSFYKFYYQLLHHWILDFDEYNIFLDYKINKEKFRLNVLREVLTSASLSSVISNVQSIHSKESLGIQLSDFLLGIVSSKFNDTFKKEGTKEKLIVLTENKLGKNISPTTKDESKFNIFNLNFNVADNGIS